MATGLLVLIIVIFTVNNIQREKRLMTRALIQKAGTLMRIVNSGSRSSFFADFRRGMHLTNPWSDHVQRVISHVAEATDIRYLTVIDEAGEIVAHTDLQQIGGTFHIPFSELQSFVEIHELKRVHYHIVPGSGKKRIFEAVRPFVPLRPFSPNSPFRSWLKFKDSFSFENGQFPRFHNRLHHVHDFDPDKQYIIVVGLTMDGYDSAIKKLYFQAFGLSIVMLLVGCGGWLSLTAVQGYRVSQQTLGDMRAFTGLLISKLPVGIIATDRDGRIKTCNAAAVEIVKMEADKILGRNPGKILPDDLSRFFEIEDESSSVDTSIPAGTGVEIQFSNGDSTLILGCRVLQIADSDGGHRGRVLLLTNLTDLKNLEKKISQHERLAAIGKMAAGVAHEVRNPLSSIKGLALLLKGKFAGESKERKTAGLLIQEVDRLNRAITELLSFTRPAALDLQEVDVGELLRKELQLIEADINKLGVSVKCEIEADLKPITADLDRLNQVFLNLLLNSLQAMREGGILGIKAENSPTENQVVVTVQDTGCGISADLQAQVFYPYFTTKPGGTGLGLAMSQKIITDHGGTISLESMEGQGTIVTVTLPINRLESS